MSYDAAYAKAWKARNRASVSVYNAKWRRLNRAKIQVKARADARRSKYGIEPHVYEAMLLAQQHSCAACRTNLAELKTRNIHIDHCHQSGKVRGILCLKCNTALGLMGDDPDKVRMLAEYIEEHQQ